MLGKRDYDLLRCRNGDNSLHPGQLLAVGGMNPTFETFPFNQLHSFMIRRGADCVKGKLYTVYNLEPLFFFCK